MCLVILVVSLILFDVLVTSVLYHRSLTHRAVLLNRWLARGLTWYMQGMAFTPPLTWVATHRLHHAHTDTPRDPYSPAFHGFFNVLLFTPFLVSRWRWRHGPEVIARLSRGVPDPGFYRLCERRWFCLTIFGSFVTGFVLTFGWLGLGLYAAQLTGFFLVVGWANAAGHTLGDRPFPISATNRPRALVSLLLNTCMFGEWLHNYHHRYPSRANFGLAGEFDLGYLVCRLLVNLGLASIRCPLEGRPTGRAGNALPSVLRH
jgi:stearoyl-CoA desaturase (Delta-9 desaturase)